MGKINNGITGGFSGTVGPVVGASWNGIAYMRSKPTFKKKRIYSQKQLNSQQQFGIATTFANSLTSLLDITFLSYAIKKTGRNAAISYLLKRVISGTDNVFVLDYEKVLISRGDLLGAEDTSAYSAADHTITFNWSDNSATRGAKANDLAIVVAYCSSLQKSVYAITDATRSGGTATIAVSAFAGQTVHTWLGFISKNGKEVADSVYTGALVI